MDGWMEIESNIHVYTPHIHLFAGGLHIV